MHCNSGNLRDLRGVPSSPQPAAAQQKEADDELGLHPEGNCGIGTVSNSIFPHSAGYADDIDASCSRDDGIQ